MEEERRSTVVFKRAQKVFVDDKFGLCLFLSRAYGIMEARMKEADLDRLEEYISVEEAIKIAEFEKA